MPQAIFVVAGQIAGAVAYATGSAIAGYVTGSFFAVASIGGSMYALKKVTQSLIKLPRIPKPQNDVEYSGNIEPRRIVYGEMLVSGMNVIPPLTSGTNNEYLHQVLALSGHELNSIGQIYFNRTAIGTITAITGSDDDGKVTSGA